MWAWLVLQRPKAECGREDRGAPQLLLALAMVAREPIFHGEELFHDYGELWWKSACVQNHPLIQEICPLSS